MTFSGLSLTGAGAGNYALSTTTLTTTGDIAKRALTLKAVADRPFTKVYDGNTSVTEAMQRGVNYTLEGVVEGEDATVVTLVYGDKE